MQNILKLRVNAESSNLASKRNFQKLSKIDQNCPKLLEIAQRSCNCTETTEPCSNLIILTKNVFFQNFPKLSKTARKRSEHFYLHRNCRSALKLGSFIQKRVFPKLSKTFQNYRKPCYLVIRILNRAEFDEKWMKSAK